MVPSIPLPTASVLAACVAACVVAQAATAQEQTFLDATAFEKRVEGQTYYSSRDAQEPYGMLLYRENRQVTWASFGDECVDGVWSEPLPGVICFDYPDWNAQYCWQFFVRDEQLNSVFYQGNGDIYHDAPTSDTMPCLGPYLGA